MGMTKHLDVIVVGAGLAGLAAGAMAARAGASTLVLEARQPGGRARVVERDGFRWNMGVHALYRRGAGMDVLREAGLSPTGGRPPLDRYRALADGHLHDLPVGPASLLRTSLLGARDKAALTAFLVRLPLMGPAALAGRSVDEWLAQLGLRPGADRALRALIRLGTYASELSTFGADAALGQLQAASSGGVLYLDGGWTQLIAGLGARCPVRTGVKVTGLEPAAGRVEVHTADGALVASQVIVATGTPAAAAAVVPGDPGWGDLGPEVTAACLDVGTTRLPDPGYVLGLDQPLYTTVQSPPAGGQAPPGCAVVASLRHGVTDADDDRRSLEAHMAVAGVRPEDVVARRFLARMVVTGAAPVSARGGLAGRPPVTTACPGVLVAGDWVGPTGLLADAALASAREAARRAVEAARLAPAGAR